MNHQKIIEKGKEVIAIEIQGLKLLKNSLSDTFIEVCEALLSVKGRVIISGIGKSGHIGAKITATLASTGTPASFVHPAEALHGDLGMITKNDIVIAISNSGNTAELSGIINHCTRFNILLIAITSNLDSELGKAAKHCLLLPKAKEACPLGLAPTTSTTNMLALGDAIAITLLDLKGFQAEDFKIFHPGGSLGNQLLNLAEIMHQGGEIPLINSGSTMDKALITITSHKFGCVGVINPTGELIGVVTDGDIRRNMNSDLLKQEVDSIMTKKFMSVKQNQPAAKALFLMNDKKITSLFIVKDRKPVGIIHIHDLLNLGVI